MNINKPKYFLIKMLIFALILIWISDADCQETKPVRESMKTIIETLQLSSEQALNLKSILNDFKIKNNELNNQTGSMTQEEFKQRRQQLQRDFFDRLSEILTSEQIQKYRTLVGAKKVENQNNKQEQQRIDDRDSAHIEIWSIPKLRNLDNALKQIELSGLQQQAVSQFMSEIASQVKQFKFLDINYDLFSDPSFYAEIEKQLMWMLTPGQFEELNALLKSMPDEPETTTSTQP